MAAACPTGGALGPCRGRSPGSPRGEGVRLCSLDSLPRVCARVHPHPHPHVCWCTCHTCTLPQSAHACTVHRGHTRGVRVTGTARSTRHTHRPRAHLPAQPRTRVFPSPASARLSLPCAASSPGLVSFCVGAGGSRRARSFQIFPHTCRGGGRACPGSQARCPVSQHRILDSRGSCKLNSDLVMDPGVQYCILTRQPDKLPVTAAGWLSSPPPSLLPARAPMTSAPGQR